MAELEAYYADHPDELGTTVQSTGQNGKGTREELLARIKSWKQANGGVI